MHICIYVIICNYEKNSCRIYERIIFYTIIHLALMLVNRIYEEELEF